MEVNETIGEGFMFSGIFHDFETVLGHKSLQTLSREHVTSEMLSNICKIRIGVEEMFCVVKHMVCRGTLSEDLGLADVKVEVTIFFENGRQHRYELEGCRKCREDIPIVGVCQTFNLWKFPGPRLLHLSRKVFKYSWDFIKACVKFQRAF